jgi:L-rhamnose-H+ transport protein
VLAAATAMEGIARKRRRVKRGNDISLSQRSLKLSYKRNASILFRAARMIAGVLLAVLSGACNGLFTTPMKMQPRWKWENLWLVFIVVACLAMPIAIVMSSVPGWTQLVSRAPRGALTAALAFGFAWGFGAISFGQSVDSLGVSIANSLVIGLSSALGSLVPLILGGNINASAKLLTLFAGIAAFLVGVTLCGRAGIMRDRASAAEANTKASARGYVFAIAAGIMSAIFNIGFTLARPIAKAGTVMGISEFSATNCIWLLMLGAGAIPNIVYCTILMRRNGTAGLLFDKGAGRGWVSGLVMGLLWGGSIFLYGAAVTKLGDIGPSIGWPLSLAVGLVVANGMGLLLGEWRNAGREAVAQMRWGLATLMGAIVLCAISARMSG